MISQHEKQNSTLWSPGWVQEPPSRRVTRGDVRLRGGAARPEVPEAPGTARSPLGRGRKAM